MTCQAINIAMTTIFPELVAILVSAEPSECSSVGGNVDADLLQSQGLREDKC